MPPFHYGKVQVQFGSAFEFGTHRNEEQSEGGQMETDLVVALESHPTKLEATFGIGNIFGTTYLSSNVKGFGPIWKLALVKVSVPSNDVIDSIISSATIKRWQ